MSALELRERTLISLAVCTGLRKSELFALQWQDVHFELGQLNVVRSIVQQVVGVCKTESSKKPVPLDPFLIKVLQEWFEVSRYKEPSDWVFASPHTGGKNPYSGQALMRRNIRPIAQQLGIRKRLGWHTFRHTFATLLHDLGTNMKVAQELLRHSTIRVTLDYYTQALTPAKRVAQSAIVSLLFCTGR